MKDSVVIPLEEYECLRRHLNEAMEILRRMEVGEPLPVPKLSPAELRTQKYELMLATGQRGKKHR